MRYINKVTKATLDTNFKISGGDWVLATELKKSAEVAEPDEVEEKSTEVGDEAYDVISKAQIMQELDAFGVEYDKKANKRVLYDLMMAQGA